MKDLKLKLLAYWGYIYCGLLIAVTLGGVGYFVIYSVTHFQGTQLIKKPLIAIVIFGGYLLWILVTTLFHKAEKPEGHEISASASPELFQIIDEVCKKTKCPKMDKVFIIHGMNAFILEQRTFTAVGKLRRYMFLGLPLIMALPKDELKAVIAHECGHLSKSHSSNYGKLYRAKVLWDEIYSRNKAGSRRDNFFITAFLYRYLPVLNDALFQFSRKNEFIADQIAAEATNPEILISALARLSWGESLLNARYWSEISKLNRMEANAPSDLYSRMFQSLQEPWDEALTESYLEQLSAITSLPFATHPSFKERAENLGCQTPKTLAHQVGTALIKESNHPFILALSTDWRNNMYQKWHQQHYQFEEARKALDVARAELPLDTFSIAAKQYLENNQKISEGDESGVSDEAIKQNEGNASLDSFFDLARLTEIVDGSDAALTLYQKMLEYLPEHLGLKYHIGRIALLSGQAEGVALLEETMEEEPQFIPDCCEHLMNYALMQGERQKAIDYYSYAIGFVETLDEAKEERATVREDSKYTIHDWSHTSVMKLIQAMKASGKVKKAYLVTRVLKYAQVFPQYILLMHLEPGMSQEAQNALREAIYHEIAPTWHLFMIISNKHTLQMEFDFQSIPDSRIL